MRLIINENQAKKLIDIIISEQNVNIARGGTDLRTVSHKYLTINHGLPDGKNHENYYYRASGADIINLSKTGNLKNFLSVFQPIQIYNKSKDAYLDYIDVDGDTLTQEDMTQKVRKTFPLTNESTVTAAHNGLLAIARAMVALKGTPGTLTIQFGAETEGEEAKDERFAEGVKYLSATSYNLNGAVGGLLSLISLAAIKPEYRKYTSLYSNYANVQDNQLYSLIQKFIKGIIGGANAFFDPENIGFDEVIEKLTPSGYVTDSSVDISPLLEELTKLRNMDDKLSGAFFTEYANRKDYNTEKYNQIKRIGNQYLPKLLEDMKQKYISNFKIFASVYLPEYADVIARDADTKVIFPTNMSLAEQHKSVIMNKSLSGGGRTTSLQTTSQKFDK